MSQPKLLCQVFCATIVAALVLWRGLLHSVDRGMVHMETPPAAAVTWGACTGGHRDVHVGWVQSTRGSRIAALGGAGHWFHVFQEAVPFYTDTAAEQLPSVNATSAVTLLVLLEDEGDWEQVNKMALLFLAGAFSSRQPFTAVHFGSRGLRRDIYRIRYQLRRAGEGQGEVIPCDHVDLHVPASCIAATARLRWGRVCSNTFRAPVQCAYDYMTETRRLARSILGVCGIAPRGTGQPHNRESVPLPATLRSLVNPFAEPEIGFLHYYYRYANTAEKQLLKAEVGQLLQSTQVDLSRYYRRGIARSVKKVRMLIYQRDKSRKFVSVDEMVRVFKSKLSRQFGAENDDRWELVVHIHDDAHPPCALLQRAAQADVVISSHGFQNILINFLAEDSLFVEVEPFGYLRYELFASFVAGYNYRYNESRVFLVAESPPAGVFMNLWAIARSHGYFHEARDCLRFAPCRYWSRLHDVSLSEDSMDDILEIFLLREGGHGGNVS